MLTQEDLNKIEKIVKKAIAESVSGGAIRIASTVNKML